jgi:hypothetical protein
MYSTELDSFLNSILRILNRILIEMQRYLSSSTSTLAFKAWVDETLAYHRFSISLLPNPVSKAIKLVVAVCNDSLEQLPLCKLKTLIQKCLSILCNAMNNSHLFR